MLECQRIGRGQTGHLSLLGKSLIYQLMNIEGVEGKVHQMSLANNIRYGRSSKKKKAAVVTLKVTLTVPT